MSEPVSTWAVLSVFSPDGSLLANVGAIREQVDAVVVVDDHGPDPDEDVFAALVDEGVEVFRQPDNLGIAAALNRGIAAAFERGAGAVVLFDQDSVPPAGMVAALRDALEQARAKGVDVSYAVPEFWSQTRQVMATDPSGVLLAREPIQSGTYLPRSTWDRLGPLREDLFIDLVDVEYALRAEAAGMPPVAAPGTRLGHRLGAAYRRPWWAGRFAGSPLPSAVTLSTPFRYYYRVRNRRVINRAYGGRFRRRLTIASVVEALHLVEVIAFARPRSRMLRVVLRAWRDGGSGRSLGRMPASVQADLMDVRWRLRPLASGAERPE
ncbi:glycosyltransferase [Aeromicrobium camelliae]|uniref:Glycosyltransferase n=1 Tax=Aeromicrobium camelliae TaxID=1538144 RepID=A0A3N6ZFR4_9ACTN|nr:glycosyltransferase [Aeromicrobium camelliae]RQN08951.1 glycosyltransferase [Aeromicrobium camelliae]